MTSFDITEYRAMIESAFQHLEDSIKAHFTKAAFHPRVLIVCGSGLGGICDKLQQTPPPLSIPFDKIPGCRTGTVKGHQSMLMLGYMKDVPVVLMKGRLHGYEGYTLQETTFLLRVLNRISTLNILITTNAAGSLEPSFNVGDIMCINDHINFPGLAGTNPLIGPNFDECGPRFLATTDAYDLELRQLLFRRHRELKINRNLHEGVYAHVFGPTYESRAESRLLRLMGGCSVGMSTIPEVLVARHCGWRVLALSLITNNCLLDPPTKATEPNADYSSSGKASHYEVLENSIKASTDVESLIEAVIQEL
ncbi:HEL031Wp [Eremothecium sinecaudum]|uniref:Purine nucleoside phosphorylase n=1 Tax=Eremothecium sinecaudum TaxID=45286 RepID=A0A0X8HTP1_9SACH|nr:HEL031Wp [Eremothecium sinecaudum]AMD21249.1 HEL031Wp [Eremothecium sinecaudum]